MLDNHLNMEKEDIFSISLLEIREVEQNILNYMILSRRHFVEIVNKLDENDFTFNAHRIIFRHFNMLQESILEEGRYGIDDTDGFIHLLSRLLCETYDLRKAILLEVLSQPASIDIEKDLELLNANAMEKDIAASRLKYKRTVSIETKEGEARLVFADDKLLNIETSYIRVLPCEAHDSFSSILESLSKLDLENENNEVSMTFYGGTQNPEGIESIELKKDLQKRKWFDEIYDWADSYGLSDAILPRDRYALEDLDMLDISNMGIKELPQEIGRLRALQDLKMNKNSIETLPKGFYQLKNLKIFFFADNKISSISQEIGNMKNLWGFVSCNNRIDTLPDSFYTLSHLVALCLQGNKITSISDKIGNLSSLEVLALSDNTITILPQSMAKLDRLKSLYIEHTEIKEMPLALLKHKSLDELKINDSLLAFVAKNIEYLNVDTINIKASDFEASSKIVQTLDLKIDRENHKDEEKKEGDGYVVLFKEKDDKK